MSRARGRPENYKVEKLNFLVTNSQQSSLVCGFRPESVVNAMKVKLSSVLGKHRKLRSQMKSKPLAEALRESESELKKKVIKSNDVMSKMRNFK